MKPRTAQAMIPLGTKFSVPLDLATETLAIVARKGAGKTYTGKVFAEGLLDAHVPVVVIDPLDVWWGLRVHADGKRAGKNVIIFGGSHADLPLTEHLGKTLADLVVSRGISAVLVLDHLSGAAQRRFVCDFCERIFELKSAQENRTPLHLIIDEADSFAPQRVFPDVARCLGAVDRIVRRGRSRGLGTTSITQRPATLNKDVLTQTEVLIAMQVTAPQDRDALTEWIKANADTSEAKTFLGSLAGMERGEAWIWSPSRLKVLERITIRTATTYDSSYTPRIGEKRPKPPHLRPVDLDMLREQLATVVKEADENDPAKLKARIRKLEAEVAAKAKASGASVAELSAAREEGARAALVLVEAKHASWAKTLSTLAADVTAYDGWKVTKTERIQAAAPNPRIYREFAKTAALPGPRRSAKATIEAPYGGQAVKLSKAERAILTALMQHESRRMPKTRVAIRAGYSHKGGGFNNALSHLRTLGCITGNGDDIQVTDVGANALGEFEALPTGSELLAYWMNNVGKAERSILDVLNRNAGNALGKETLADASGYEAGGGGFNNAISRLRSLELIEGRGEIRLSPNLQD